MELKLSSKVLLYRLGLSHVLIAMGVWSFALTGEGAPLRGGRVELSGEASIIIRMIVSFFILVFIYKMWEAAQQLRGDLTLGYLTESQCKISSPKLGAIEIPWKDVHSFKIRERKSAFSSVPVAALLCLDYVVGHEQKNLKLKTEDCLIPGETLKEFLTPLVGVSGDIS